LLLAAQRPAANDAIELRSHHYVSEPKTASFDPGALENDGELLASEVGPALQRVADRSVADGKKLVVEPEFR